jgi:heterodisulfide reductase subunit B
MKQIVIFTVSIIGITAIAVQIKTVTKHHRSELRYNELKMEKALREMEYPIDVIKAPPEFPCMHSRYLLIDATGPFK